MKSSRQQPPDQNDGEASISPETASFSTEDESRAATSLPTAGAISTSTSSSPSTSSYPTKKHHHLSPAAASALDSNDDAASNDVGVDADVDMDTDTVPTAVSASPHSSAPSSPKGSVIDGSSGDEGREGGPGSVPCVVSNGAAFRGGHLANGDTGNREGNDGLGEGHAPDPYADVRERMEELSRRDEARFALHSRERAEDAVAGKSSPRSKKTPLSHPEITTFAAITTYLGYIVLIITGHVRDICASLFRKGRYFRSTGHSKSKSKLKSKSRANFHAQPSSLQTIDESTALAASTNYPSDDPTRYAPLLKSWENFYTRRLYHRIQDCFNRPIASRPSATISVLERVSFDGNKTMSVLGPLSHLADPALRASYLSGRFYDVLPADPPHHPLPRVVRRCLNLGSYNYLGFADDWDATCKSSVLSSLLHRRLPSSVSSPRAEFGTTSLHAEVEAIVSSFLGKDDAVVLNMGFNTNATILPTLASRGDLIVSDELNHTSIVNGARASGAAIRTFAHNDSCDLEGILREAIVWGQPRTRRPWNRILVVVEGIYSMEGEYCDLRNIVDVCKKYGAYVYLDEAHSIGAMGETGRGCCEYTGVDPKEVDVLMGTFTKSFGGMGGYVAGDRNVIDFLRRECAGSVYHNSISPVVCQQIIRSFEVIMGRDGTDTGKRKLNALRDNSNYFRMRLTDMGLHVLGHYDSPIMPVMLYNPTKIAAFSRECLKRGLAVVVVGFPAVPILMSRARFCISAGHTREDLDRALVELEEIADLLKLRYARSTFG